MTSEITNPQMCLYMRNGIEIWIDKDKSERIQQDLESGEVAKFIRVEGKTVNTVEIVGVFDPNDLNDMKRMKRGEWECEYHSWHKRNEDCECWRRVKPKLDVQSTADNLRQKYAEHLAERKTLDKVKKELQVKGIVK